MSKEEKFKAIIQALLCSIGNKICTERELRKVYREEEGHNINLKIEEIYGKGMTLYNFLRFKCSDILHTYKLDGEVKIDKFKNDKTSHLDNLTKSQNEKRRRKKKRTMASDAAPRLNYPKSNFLVNIPRSNPQGFNKKRNLNNLYLDPFADADKKKVSKEYQAPEPKITLSNFLDDKLDFNDNEVSQINNKLNDIKINEKQEKEKEIPRIMNPFQFPTLPKSIEGVRKDEDGLYSNLSELKSTPQINRFYENHLDEIEVERTPQIRDISSQIINNYSADYAEQINRDSKNIEIDFINHAGNIKKPLPFILPTLDDSNNDEFNSMTCLDDSDLGISMIHPPPSLPSPISMPQKVKEEPKLTMILQCDDAIFLMDFPDIILTTDVKIAKPTIHYDTNSNVEKRFTIFLTTVFSPSQFYFQYDEETLIDLMNELQIFYNDVPEFGLTISHNNLKIGLLVAAKLEDIWHRAEIISVNDDGNVELFFNDFGSSYTVHALCLRYLLQRFANIPMKSLRGALFNISSKINQEWSFDARTSFFNKVCNKTVFATVRSKIEEYDCYELDIFENRTSTKTIADEFIDLNYGQSNMTDASSIPYATLLSNPIYS